MNVHSMPMPLGPIMKKNPKAYRITKRIVKKGDVLTIDEARGGGFAMSLIKK